VWRVGGRTEYLFRAVDRHGMLIDFLLPDRQNTSAFHRILSDALAEMRNCPSFSITTDELRSALRACQAGCSSDPNRQQRPSG
jgi:transposase, IS6 family